ncbi:hypothetical protein GCM10011612_17450 [Actinomyces gaoshouyii]|uniref:Uncharacterized protein n=1 Tax=Actinomyces gaoshouyii TaxID=1960083 RepID=A0A8H9H9Q5_9ACTO|nr:hypothetical protein GCM10011612_17450 [Actinomyces gaoshouyii]
MAAGYRRAGGDTQVDSGTRAGAVDSPAPPPGSASGAAARPDHDPYDALKTPLTMT